MSRSLAVSGSRGCGLMLDRGRELQASWGLLSFNMPVTPSHARQCNKSEGPKALAIRVAKGHCTTRCK